MSTAAVTPSPNQPQPGAQQQPQAGAVPMQFSDGSQSMVPKEKVVDAMYDGGELLHPMKFPDGSQAMVAHSKLAGAMKDGGQRLDTKPIPAATWQQYVGSAFGAATDTTLGAETGEKSLGRDVTQGLTEAGSGHPVRGVARVAEAVGEAVSPAATAGLGGDVAPIASAAADDLPAPSLKVLYKVVRDANLKSEISSGMNTAAASNKVADIAYKGAAEARQAGDSATAKMYDVVAMTAKGYGKYKEATARILDTVPFAGGATLAYEMYEHYAALHNMYQGVRDYVVGADKDDARKTLFGDQ